MIIIKTAKVQPISGDVNIIVVIVIFFLLLSAQVFTVF